MKLLPVLALTLLVCLGGLTACGDEAENGSDGAATSAPDETAGEQETADVPADGETAETSKATNRDVIAYCEIAATMAKRQAAEEDFGDETAKLSELTSRIAKASATGDLTEADNKALSDCSEQIDEVYKAAR